MREVKAIIIIIEISNSRVNETVFDHIVMRNQKQQREEPQRERPHQAENHKVKAQFKPFPGRHKVKSIGSQNVIERFLRVKLVFEVYIVRYFSENKIKIEH